jgi:malonyl-CoA O-methyltransferase
MIDKEVVKRNFSRYAHYYDRYSTMQNLCATNLITKLDGSCFADILDIGCGTGNYTELLREKFPKARIKALDISGEMIEVAKGKLQDERIEFITADGETIDFKEHFDLISSNASFQWFEDLEKALSRYKGCLAENGVILFSTFGPLTFCELDNSLKEFNGGEAAISSCNFFERAEIEKALKRWFRSAKIEEKLYKERYDSLPELLKKIKYTGTRGNGIIKNGFWTPKIMSDLDKIYKEKYKNIIATYQVFFCRGIK